MVPTVLGAWLGVATGVLAAGSRLAVAGLLFGTAIVVSLLASHAGADPCARSAQPPGAP